MKQTPSCVLSSSDSWSFAIFIGTNLTMPIFGFVIANLSVDIISFCKMSYAEFALLTLHAECSES